MTISIESTSNSLPEATPPELSLELLELEKKEQKEWVLKTLFASALLVVGVCMVALFGSNLLAVGIAIILISSLAIYQYFSHYRNSKNIFLRAANAIAQNFS